MANILHHPYRAPKLIGIPIPFVYKNFSPIAPINYRLEDWVRLERDFEERKTIYPKWGIDFC